MTYKTDLTWPDLTLYSIDTIETTLRLPFTHPYRISSLPALADGTKVRSNIDFFLQLSCFRTIFVPSALPVWSCARGPRLHSNIYGTWSVAQHTESFWTGSHASVTHDSRIKNILVVRHTQITQESLFGEQFILIIIQARAYHAGETFYVKVSSCPKPSP